MGSILTKAKLVIPQKLVNTMFIVCAVTELRILAYFCFIIK